MSDYQRPDRDNRSRRDTRRPSSHEKESSRRPNSFDQEPTRRPSPPSRLPSRSRSVDDESTWYEDEPRKPRPASPGRHSEDEGRRHREARSDGSRSRSAGRDRQTAYPASSGQDGGAVSRWDDEPAPERDRGHGPRGWDDEDWEREEYPNDGRRARRPSSRSSWQDGSDYDDDYSAGNSGRAEPYRQHRGDARAGGTGGLWGASRQWASQQGQRFLGSGQRATPDGASTKPGLLGTRRRIITIVVLACMLLGVVGSGLTLFVQYEQISSFAHSGLQHVKNAEGYLKQLQTNPLNSLYVQAAHLEFSGAYSDFSGINARLNLVGFLSGAPLVGSKIRGAQKLVPIAVEATQAGMLACDMLNTLVTSLKSPFGTSGGGLTSSQYAIIAGKWSEIYPMVNTIIGQLGQLTPSDLALDSRLGPLMAQFTSQLPQITQLMNDFNGVIAALPQLLGVNKPSTYLMLILDSSELRPTGGFIGNFGALQVNRGQADSQFHISDVTLMDSSVKFPVGRGPGTVAYGQVIHLPSQYAWFKSIFAAGATDSWSLRDSNLDPDYPTSSKNALQLYQQLQPDAQKNLQAQSNSTVLYNPQTSGAFAGVITLSYGFFVQALKITGSVTVNTPPFHNVEVTSDNFVSLIHYYSLGAGATGFDSQACGSTSCSKVFTSAVVQAFMAKLKTNMAADFGQLGKLFIDSLRTKDIEVFVSEPKTEQTLIDLGMAASVQAPATGDSVFEVETNIGGNKDNYFLQYQMSDQITIDQSGTATHHLSWKYTWPNDQNTKAEAFAAGNIDYHSYSRVFVPPSATLISQSNLAGFGQSAASADTFNRKVFHGAAYAYFAKTSSYAVSWKTPGVVTHDSSGYHYHLLFQREAGIVWPLTLTIALPACAQVTGTPQVSGLTPLNLVTVKGTTVTVTGPITEDEQIQVNYSC